MEKKWKIIIVDDNKQFLESLVVFIKQFSDFDIVDVVESDERLLNYPDLVQADIVLLDIELPGLSGFEIAKKMNWNHNHVKLIAITMYEEKVYLQKLIS
jgi:DNA-binding NarL/FixJ family response regulator